MELSQLRLFTSIVEHGGLARAATALGIDAAELGRQLALLEAEVGIALLRVEDRGALPTEAGLGFLREAQQAMRHADAAARVARQAGLAGSVGLGLAPTACALLGTPLLLEVREKYPDVRLRIVESLSGDLARMLDSRQLDLAVLYGTHTARRWTTTPLLEERLYLIQSAARPVLADAGDTIGLRTLQGVALMLPSSSYGLRSALEAAFMRAGVQPKIEAEIDSLATLMAAVDAGIGATIQPWTATRRIADADTRFRLSRIDDPAAVRRSQLCSLPSDELSPAAQMVRVLLAARARELVGTRAWVGARLCQG